MPHARRFPSQELRGFEAGDANFYRYVGNNPTNATDPDGMEEVRLAGPGFASAFRSLNEGQTKGGADSALSSADVALLADLIRGTSGSGAPYDANGKRVRPGFDAERGYGFRPDGTYVYYKPGVGWLSPCVVCHGQGADGPLPGLTLTDSFVGGRWYHSGDNLNILRNYSAGVASTVVTAIPNLINLVTYLKRMALQPFTEYDYTPLIDTESIRERVEDFIYPNRDRGVVSP